ncbi:MAG TPA: glycosyltransferase family 39 protein [Candidatus Nanoarchaeia archaeon]|nr:glycosyltransferase family 39 protein [Candidatus Nanoarchaeia archaeon]
MDRFFKKLMIVFIVLVLLKIAIAFFVLSPSTFADDYHYMKMARSFFHDGSFTVDGRASYLYPPLYPIVISISYIFKNMEIIYFIFKIINAILSSLIIFPAWLIAKEFFDKKKSFLIASLIGIMPPFFVFSSYILSENLFFPLFLFTIYFIYKSFNDNKIRWDVLAGIFLGLSYLTRILALSLIPTIVIILFIKLFRDKDYSQIKKKIILFLIAFIVVLPWLIRNLSIFGFSISGLFGYGENITAVQNNFTPLQFFYWIIIDVGYILLASGILFFIGFLINIKKQQDKKINLLNAITILSSLFLIFIAATHSSSFPLTKENIFNGRVLGRYLEGVLPLIIILGAVSIEKNILQKTNKKILILLMSILVVITTTITFRSLLPINSSSLSYIGVFTIFLGLITKHNVLILAIIMFFIPFLIMKIYNYRLERILKIYMVFFFLITLFGSSIAIYNSYENWYLQDQTWMGKWMDKNVKEDSLIMFDRRNEDEDFRRGTDVFGKKDRSVLVMGYWMNKNTVSEYLNETKVKPDYIISTYELDYPIILKSENREQTIYVYDSG